MIFVFVSTLFRINYIRVYLAMHYTLKHRILLRGNLYNPGLSRYDIISDAQTSVLQYPPLTQVFVHQKHSNRKYYCKSINDVYYVDAILISDLYSTHSNYPLQKLLIQLQIN